MKTFNAYFAGMMGAFGAHELIDGMLPAGLMWLFLSVQFVFLSIFVSGKRQPIQKP